MVTASATSCAKLLQKTSERRSGIPTSAKTRGLPHLKKFMRDYYDSDGPETPNSSEHIPQPEPHSSSNETDDKRFEESEFRKFSNIPNEEFHSVRDNYPPQKSSNSPNHFAIAAFSLSLFAVISCCCCSSFSSTYLVILCEVLAITLAILSRQGQRMHALAIAAIVIAVITLIGTALIIVLSIYLQTHPEVLIEYLSDYVDTLKASGLNDDELNYLRQLLRQFGIDPSEVGLWLHFFR